MAAAVVIVEQWRGARPHLVIHAGAALRLRGGAFSERKNVMDECHCLACNRSRGKGTEVHGTVFRRLPCQFEVWVAALEVELDVKEPFRGTKGPIVHRLLTLDKSRLPEKSFGLGTG